MTSNRNNHECNDFLAYLRQMTFPYKWILKVGVMIFFISLMDLSLWCRSPSRKTIVQKTEWESVHWRTSACCNLARIIITHCSDILIASSSLEAPAELCSSVGCHERVNLNYNGFKACDVRTKFQSHWYFTLPWTNELLQEGLHTKIFVTEDHLHAYLIVFIYNCGDAPVYLIMTACVKL